MRQELDSQTNKPLISRDIDQAIGERVRFRRQVLGLSQDDLARLCNISPQQIHKYEKGISGLRPHRLVRFADVLGVPVMRIPANTGTPSGHCGQFRALPFGRCDQHLWMSFLVSAFGALVKRSAGRPGRPQEGPARTVT